MKYLKLFESFDESEIHKICKKYKIKNYTINSDGSIDVDVAVNLYNEKGLTKLPVKFNKVSGNFWCSSSNLISLEGSPTEVNGNFLCTNNELTSFQYSPKIIRGDFYCSKNNIKTFEYFPNHVGGLDCRHNPIYEIWELFKDNTKIELLNDCDIFRDEETNTPSVIIDRLNDFLLTIGKPQVYRVYQYRSIL